MCHTKSKKNVYLPLAQLILYLLLPIVLKSANPLILSENNVSYDISEYIDYFVDSSATFAFEQIKDSNELFLNHNHENSPLNLGINNKTHWFKFSVKNNTPLNNWMLEIDYPRLNDVSCYIVDENNMLDTIIFSGTDRKFNNNLLINKSIYFDQIIPKNATLTFFLRIRTDSFIVLPISISSTNYFIKKHNRDSSLLVLLYSIFLTILLFNIIFYLLTFDRNYFLLSLVLATMAIESHFLYGIGFDIFSNLSNYWESRMQLIVFTISSIFFLLFLINYLHLKKYKILYLIDVFLIILGIIFFLTVIFAPGIRAKLSMISSILYMIGALFSFVSSIYALKMKENLAIYLLISFSFITIGAVITPLTQLGFLPFNFVTYHINSITADIFGLLLTIGLVDKITAIRKEKAKSKKLSTLNYQLSVEIEERKKIENALRESEEKFRLLFELSPQPISLTEMETGQIIDFNHQVEKITGLSKPGAIGKTSIDLNVIQNDDRNKILAALQHSNEVLGLEIKLHPINGEPAVSVLAYTHVIPIQGKNILISVFSDITEIKKNQEGLKLSEKKLRELNSTKDKFFSIIAHDLMNPFNALIGFSELITDSIKNNNHEESLNYAHYIGYSSRRIFGLLQNLLIWSRSQSGKIVFSPVEIDIVELITSSINVLKNFAYTKDIEILVDDIDNGTIWVDQNMIETVIRNLVSNAIKFSKNGSKVFINVKKDELFFTFCVTDSGIGIDAAKLKNIFVLDKTVSTIGTDGEIGIGLGLVLCHEFVTTHGGKLWAESEPKKGSKFCFTIPRNFSLIKKDLRI